MARAAVAALWAGVVACALSGCGTVHNFCGDDADAGPCRVFGGVRSDVTSGVRYLRNPTGDHGDYPAEVCADPAVQFYARAIGWYLLAVDLPLSAVGDTLTLPWALLSQVAGDDAAPEPTAKQGRQRTAQTSAPAGALPGGW
jgi:uncharacterized protein YceK